ncbi:lipoprotein [Spiroplasma endosymbiont of Cantharis lateralis]|uniref:lipoprotein n=1 Tax=Spiroplasma endosymbiont of Cantharis lateralis TaxID=3066277 RepID=UPI00313CAFD2
MKKLLAIFGSSLLVVSSTFLVVSCTKNKKVIDDISLQTAVEQIGKSIYLTDTKNYNFDYQMNGVLKNKRIKDISNVYGSDNYTKDDLNSYSRFDQLYKYYFDKNLFNDNLKVDEKINFEGNIRPKNSGSLETILVTIPNLLELLGNGKIITLLFKLFTIIPSFIVNLSDNYLVSYLDKILSKENSDAFSNAFSNESYDDFTNQESLNSAIIGFSNSIDYLIGNKNKLEIPTKDEVEGEYFLNSIDKLTSNLKSIFNSEKLISLDLIIDLPAIAEMIRFVRTLIVYIANGVETIYTKSESNGSKNYFKEIEVFRNTKIDDTKNEVNILNFLDLLESTYKNGNGLKLILALLFQSYENPKLKVSWGLPRLGVIADENIQLKGINPLLQASMNAIFPTFYITEGLSPIIANLLKLFKIDRVNLASVCIELLNSLASGSNFKGIIDIMNHSLVSSIIKDENLKEKLKSLKIIEEIYKNSLWDELYSGKFINKFLLVLNNKENEEDINIKNIIENTNITFLGKKFTYKEVFWNIINNEDFEGEFKFNFTNISEVIINLRRILDLKNGEKIEADLYKFQTNLQTLFVNLQGSKKLTSWVTNPKNEEESSLWEKYRKEQSKYNKKINDDILNQEIISIIDLKNYSYQVEVENKKYTIKLKMLKSNNKFQISSIF